MNEELQYGRASDIWNVLIFRAAESKTITYKALSEEINVHHRALRYALGVIQEFCQSNKLPHLTALVVNSTTGMPGAGNNLDDSLLDQEYQKIYRHNWASMLNPFNNENLKNTHSWWESSLEEKFWVESTDRTDIGRNLLAPISKSKISRARYVPLSLHWTKSTMENQFTSHFKSQRKKLSSPPKAPI